MILQWVQERGKAPYFFQTDFRQIWQDAQRRFQSREAPKSQSLFSVFVFLTTKESRSKAITADIINRDGEYILCYSYLNRPKVEIRERSEIHYGTSILSIGEKSQTLEGEYYTDRNTAGDICLRKTDEV